MPSHLLLRVLHHLRDRCFIHHTDRLHDEHLRPRDRNQERCHPGFTHTDRDRDVHLLVGDGVGSHKTLGEPITAD